ncbi:MAG: hypothetical protein OXU23_28120 [Candidatus Poribacteria bacterium]|nr:hypothetical protein [Candidatus Poribacteria bacterium]
MFRSYLSEIFTSKYTHIKSATLALLICTSISFNVYAVNPYTVHTVYFIPKDSQDQSELLDLDDMMKSIQMTYQLEMDRHGFGNKTFELETDKDGKVVVHKVRGNHNKVIYANNSVSIIKELEAKPAYNDPHTIYAVVAAGIEIFEGGGAGVAVAKPWAGWFGNGNPTYSGYAVSTERPQRIHVESIIRHEIGHTFGLSHILYHRGTHYNSGDYIMHNAIDGKGDELTEHEARWLSKVRHFNGNQPFRNNFAPKLTKFDGAVRVDDNITLKATIRDPDNDGIFQVYGKVDWWVIGWDTFDGNSGVEESFLTDIPDDLLKSGKITYYFMDIHGNWMYDFPDKSFTVPKKIKKPPVTFNKNEDLGIPQNPTEECPGCKVDSIDVDDTPRSITSEFKLTTSWATIKSR